MCSIPTPRFTSCTFVRPHEMRDYEQPIADFASLPPAALERYARHFGLQVNGRGPSTTNLLQLVQEHFARSAVNETQALAAFEHANARTREVPSDPANAKRRDREHELPRKQKKARALTYGDMISAALKQLPSNQGTLDEICEVIEKQYSKQLNHELESGNPDLRLSCFSPSSFDPHLHSETSLFLRPSASSSLLLTCAWLRTTADNCLASLRSKNHKSELRHAVSPPLSRG